MALHQILQFAIVSYLLVKGKSASERDSFGRDLYKRDFTVSSDRNHILVEKKKVDSNRRQMKTINVCLDGTECLNGGTCVDTNIKSKESGVNHFICDCTNISGIKSYAGLHCEHEATSYCAFGAGSAGRSSFCANEGECKMITGPSQDGSITHAGCKCLDGFTGLFCEYKVGYTPEDLLKTPVINTQVAKKGRSTNENLVIAFSVIICFLLLVLGLSVLFWTRRKSQKQTNSLESVSKEFTDDKIADVEIT